MDNNSLPPTTDNTANARRLTRAVLAAVLWTGAACSMAPRYERPAVETPAAYKEVHAPSDATNIWRLAAPGDALSRGRWWEIYTNAQLAALEEQVVISNQNVAAAFANFLSARAIVKESRAQLYPTLAASPSASRTRNPLVAGSPSTVNDFALPLDASWQVDLWGRVGGAVKANSLEAVATKADLENVRLAAQSQLATAYFQLLAQDSLVQLYAETVQAYRKSLDLTKARYETGIASDEDVAQAETQLESAEAQATNLEILRAQLEHSIGVLIGRAPGAFSIPPGLLERRPLVVPSGIPSGLLERRPDIAAAERRVAEANQMIGVAKSAYYPAVTLSASGGFESLSAAKLLNWSSRFWSLGAGLGETIFDAGLRKATVEQYRAQYDGTVAKYRQTVLIAFQQVEDALATLRILAREVDQQQTVVKSSGRYLALATRRYELGIDSYLNVITAQTTYLVNRQALVALHTQEMTASVQLVQAIGGGWDTSRLPAPGKVTANSAAR